MIECTANDVCAATGATLVCGTGEETLAGVAIDSRRVGERGLFVAFPGENVDGNDYVANAIAAGAGVIAVTRAVSPEVEHAALEASCAIVRAADDDGTEFMLRLAEWWRARQDWCVVGVTGSVGKTTTKEMLAATLGAKYEVHTTAGNFNNLIGVPITLLAAPTSAQVLVVEMGMNHPGEIDRLAKCARPRVAVITNVGTSHIGLLGSRENIARAKGEIVAPLAAAPASTVAPEPRLFMCADGDYTPFIASEFAAPAGVPVTLVGTAEGCFAGAANVTLDDEAHPSFDLKIAGEAETRRVTLSLTGSQVVPDFLLALSVACHVGVDADAAVCALSSLAPAHMRQEVVRAACGCRIIDYSYNAAHD